MKKYMKWASANMILLFLAAIYSYFNNDLTAFITLSPIFVCGAIMSCMVDHFQTLQQNLMCLRDEIIQRLEELQK